MRMMGVMMVVHTFRRSFICMQIECSFITSETGHAKLVQLSALPMRVSEHGVAWCNRSGTSFLRRRMDLTT